MGDTDVCDGSTNIYSIEEVNGATSYTWTLPGGWMGSSTTNSISAIAGMFGGDITVIANNNCGSSTEQFLTVTVSDVPGSPGTIMGNTDVCDESMNTYTIIEVNGATSYTWTLPSGWIGSSSTNSISATAGNNSGDLSVVANNDCSSSFEQTLFVDVTNFPSMPNSIVGDVEICEGTTNVYSVEEVIGAISYTWTLPNNWTGSSNTNSITTMASISSGDITVIANNDCGSSLAKILDVMVSSIPLTPGDISGNANICATSMNTYSIEEVSGATSYTWILPNGWTGNSTTNSIMTTSNDSSGHIKVTANNDCGISNEHIREIIVETIPIISGSIEGDTSICESSMQTYSIMEVSGATSYSWVLPSGWTGSSTTNSILTTSNDSSGIIKVSTNNDCGSSLEQELEVMVNIVNTAVMQSGATLTAELAGAEYQWIDCSSDSILEGEINQSYVATENGDYAVIITSNDCTDTSACYNVTSTGIVNEKDNIYYEIYPNPNNGEFIISTSNKEQLKMAQLKIFDLMGKQIFNRNYIPNSVDISNMPKGIYYIQIWKDNISKTKKVILQ